MPDTTLHPPAVATSRRCWRCLQMFATDRPTPVREDFWLCAPCESTLLPSKRRSS